MSEKFKIGTSVRCMKDGTCGFIESNKGEYPYTYTMLHNPLRIWDTDLEPCDFKDAMKFYVDNGYSSEEIMKKLDKIKLLSKGEFC